MQRRTLLKLGVTSAAVLLVAGGAAALLKPGLVGGALSSAGREVFAAIGRAILDKSLPAKDGPRQIALNGLLSRVDALVQALPPHAQSELSQLLSLLASTAGRRAGGPQPAMAGGQHCRDSASASGYALVQSGLAPAGVCRPA
ncbi:hypothetical protein LP414_11395 [Polaromonas sp. P1(28)-13]|nr:hypothetical protein LP414_11395 [Polaromonas sp. P1(28)-13]